FSSRRRHTSLVSDWSSDVCSSDLHYHCKSKHAGGKGCDAKNVDRVAMDDTLLRVVEQELSRPERLIELLEAGRSQTAETRSSARTSELTTKQKRLQQEKERMLWLVIRRPHYCTSRRTFTAWARKVYLAWLWLGYEKGLLRPSGAGQARPIIPVLSLNDGHFSCRGVAQPGSAPALGNGTCARGRMSPRPRRTGLPSTPLKPVGY